MLSKTDNTEVLQPASKDKIKQVQVLERARRILRTLADCPNPISLHEISEMTEIHMSTVHRLLWNLCPRWPCGAHEQRPLASGFDLP